MFVSVALAFLAVSTAPAEPAGANSAPQSAVKEKKICVTQDAVTGSITPKRICKTKAEWDALMGRTPAAKPAGGQQPATSVGAGTSN
jgi:hypothetical protein